MNLRSAPLVDLVIAEDKLTLHVRRADPEAARGWYHGIRLPGTNLPGVITAGTFYHDGQRVFWDVHDPENTIVIELHDDRYNELVVEVENPAQAVALIRNAL